MNFSMKYRLCLHKNYFERGYGLTNYVKYVIALFGLAGGGLGETMFFAMAYIPICYLIGRWWYTRGWAKAETEVGNKVNIFVEEMRRNYKKVMLKSSDSKE